LKYNKYFRPYKLSFVNTHLEGLDRYVNRALVTLIVTLVILGAWFPVNWRTSFGAGALPIEIAAAVVPAIAVTSRFAADANLFEGFFGSATIGVILAFFYLVVKDPFRERVVLAYLRAGSTPAEATFWLYVLIAPGLILVLWLLLFLPFGFALGDGSTKIQRLIRLMLHDRMAMTLIGTFLSAGILVIMWALVVALFGPVLFYASNLFNSKKGK
jgi:hypothetical protein